MERGSDAIPDRLDAAAGPCGFRDEARPHALAYRIQPDGREEPIQPEYLG